MVMGEVLTASVPMRALPRSITTHHIHLPPPPVHNQNPNWNHTPTTSAWLSETETSCGSYGGAGGARGMASDWRTRWCPNPCGYVTHVPASHVRGTALERSPMQLRHARHACACAGAVGWKARGPRMTPTPQKVAPHGAPTFNACPLPESATTAATTTTAITTTTTNTNANGGLPRFILSSVILPCHGGSNASYASGYEGHH